MVNTKIRLIIFFAAKGREVLCIVTHFSHVWLFFFFCLTLCNPMNCSPPGSSVHEILQARIQECVAMPSSRRSFWPGDPSHVCLLLLHCTQMDSLPTGAKRSSTKSRKTRLGSDCGSDHELLIAKFRLKLKKVGKTTRPFRYDLNQIPYEYTVEVTNRFKGLLDLIDRVPEDIWMEVCDIVQEVVVKTISKTKKDKMIVWGGLTNSWE